MHHPQFDPRRFRLLRALAEPQCVILRRAARLSRIPRGGRIYSPGEPKDRVCFLSAGVVAVATVPPDGPEVHLAFAYPGEAFGESALFDVGARDDLARAHEAATVWSVGRSTLLDLLGRTPALGFALLEVTARATRHLQQRVEGLLRKDACSRVTQTLLALAAEHSVADDDGVVIPLRLTQVDLAAMAGLSRETVNIVLAGLRARGFVEMTRRSIRLRDPGRLFDATSGVTVPARVTARQHDVPLRPTDGHRLSANRMSV